MVELKGTNGRKASRYFIPGEEEELIEAVEVLYN
jgi:hypothetical protein